MGPGDLSLSELQSRSDESLRREIRGFVARRWEVVTVCRRRCGCGTSLAPLLCRHVCDNNKNAVNRACFSNRKRGPKRQILWCILPVAEKY